jgi:hypothetical protein
MDIHLCFSPLDEEPFALRPTGNRFGMRGYVLIERKPMLFTLHRLFPFKPEEHAGRFEDQWRIR